MVDTDRFTGTAKELGGKVQGAVGDLTGSHRDSVEGRAREAAGKAESLFGQAKDAVRDAAEHVADTARDLGGRIRESVGSDNIEDRTRHAQGAVEEQFGEARRSVRRVAGSAADYADEAYERGGHYLRRGTREVSHQVAEYPLASLLIAGFVGFGLGLLVTAGRD